MAQPVTVFFPNPCRKCLHYLSLLLASFYFTCYTILIDLTRAVQKLYFLTPPVVSDLCLSVALNSTDGL
jgi:hypothetical protein